MEGRIQPIYRISDNSYKKEKPEGFDKESCLKNFAKVFGQPIVVADSVNEETMDMIKKYVDEDNIHRVEIKSNGGSFRYCFQLALSMEGYVYFVEDDYQHKKGSKKILKEGLQIADYVTLYDHPDKYMNFVRGGNLQVMKGGENTIVRLTRSTHWKETNSTTMTFAVHTDTLREDQEIIEILISRDHPPDYHVFCALVSSGRVLMSPGYSCHGELNLLAPFFK